MRKGLIFGAFALGAIAFPAIGQTSASGAAAVECPQTGRQPEGCVPPPMKFEIDIFGWRLPPELTEERNDLIREVWHLSSDPIPLTEFPAALLADEREGRTMVDMSVVVEADDRVTGCEPRGVSERFTGRGVTDREDRPGDPALGALGCDLVLRHARLRHALDDRGNPVARPVGLRVVFERRRYDPLMVQAPPPIASWIKADPNGFPGFAASSVTISEPPWGEFPLRTGRSDPVRVGVQLSIAPDGSSNLCKVARPSGDLDFDLASCAALTAQRHSNRMGLTFSAYPLYVVWEDGRARLQLPGEEVKPVLLRPTALPPEASPPPGAPRYRQVEMSVDLDPEGAIVACTIDRSTLNDAWDAASCAAAKRFARIAPARDRFGDPARGGMRLALDWDKRAFARAPGY